MKRSYLLSGVALLAVVFGIGSYYLTSRMQGPTLTTQVSSVVPQGQQSVYRVNFQLDQKPQDGEPFTPYHLNGKLVAYKDVTGELVTEWGDLPEFYVLGVQAPTGIIEAMIGKPMITRRGGNGDLEHYIGQDFPGRYLGMQIGILDKAYIANPEFQDEPENRRERDEFGQFNVQYSYERATDGKSYTVTRKWTQSLDNKAVVDSNANTFQYSFNAEGHLQKVNGHLILNYKTANGGVDVYTTAFTMELDSNEPVPETKLTRATRDLPKADLTRAEVASKQALAAGDSDDSLPTIENIEEALTRVDTFTPDSPGSEQQEIFQTIKFGVMANPSEASKVYDKILSLKGEDEISEAKSSLLFGALTSTGLSEVADTFADMAQSQCPSNVCRIQAITSLNIHDNPNPANGKTLIQIAHSSNDEDIVSAAYLAAGSVASKTGNDNDEISQALLTDFSSAKDHKKVSLIQAMGNHGSSEYYSTLVDQAKSDDTFERSSALYSMRNLPVDGATQTLLSSLDVNGSDIVNVNVLRALAQKPLTAPDQVKVAEAFVSSTDKDVQAALTDMLLNNYRANVEGASEAIATLKERSTDADLKVYLDEAVEDIKKDKEKDYLYK